MFKIKPKEATGFPESKIQKRKKQHGIVRYTVMIAVEENLALKNPEEKNYSKKMELLGRIEDMFLENTQIDDYEINIVEHG